MDGCNNYTVLSEADRAQGNIVINASNYRCDRDDLVPGWYRFQGAAGDRMADKCVPLNHCGSQYPGWLNGTHPESSEGVVSRRVCYPSKFYYGYWYPSSNCCISSNIIRVKNCGAYFVYELQKPPHCNFSYCGNGSAGRLPCFLLWVYQRNLVKTVRNLSSENHFCIYMIINLSATRICTLMVLDDDMFGCRDRR